MSKLIRQLFLLILLLAALHIVIQLKALIDKQNTGFKQTPGQAQVIYDKKEEKKEAVMEGLGEKITYDIKLGNLTLGKSTFTHAARTKIGDKNVHLMIFETKLPRFSDIEKIYIDPETLLPLKVERDITNFFIKERIIENYDLDTFTVNINKKRNDKEENFVIKKDKPIHNAVLLPHFVRTVSKLDLGETLTANLPTKTYEIKLVTIENVTVPAGTFKSYHFESNPKQIEIWISADNRRIPVKIQNCAKFGYTMLLKEYSP